MHLKLYIDRLEQFSVHCGATVIRNSLVGGVLGRVEGRRIVLRSGLSLERQVLTLAHELTHLIAHCNVSPRLNRTVCEYEAEAVERWVGAELKVSPYAEEGFDVSSLTDDLLAGSVVRVRWVARTLLSAARDGVSAAVERARLQA
jgi:IrrE N-terminal-like domain